jgi:hypothetical protein
MLKIQKLNFVIINRMNSGMSARYNGKRNLNSNYVMLWNWKIGLCICTAELNRCFAAPNVVMFQTKHDVFLRISNFRSVSSPRSLLKTTVAGFYLWSRSFIWRSENVVLRRSWIFVWQRGIDACSTSLILVTSVLGLISVEPLMQFPRKSFKVI